MLALPVVIAFWIVGFLWKREGWLSIEKMVSFHPVPLRATSKIQILTYDLSGCRHWPQRARLGGDQRVQGSHRSNACVEEDLVRLVRVSVCGACAYTNQHLLPSFRVKSWYRRSGRSINGYLLLFLEYLSARRGASGWHCMLDVYYRCVNTE